MDVVVPPVMMDLGLRSVAADHLKDYYGRANDGSFPGYSGSRFDTFPNASAPQTPPNEITAEDLLAVQCLGVEFKGDAVLWILDFNHDTISNLLAEISTESCLWDVDQAGIEVDRGDGYEGKSLANRLWHVLRFPDPRDRTPGQGKPKACGVGATKVSKLMARKRPGLFPVYDDRVRRTLGRADSRKWYTNYRHLMMTTDEHGQPLHERIGRLLSELGDEGTAGIPESLSPLRACDVILWMEQKELSSRRPE